MKTPQRMQLALGMMMALASAPGWSGTTAQDLVEACRNKQSKAKSSCYEQGLLNVLARSGVKTAMETLAAAAELDRDVQRDGHVYAHVVGITAYDRNKDVGEIFRSCSPLFQSGCYHGVIQSYLQDVLDPSMSGDAARINGVCQAYRDDPAGQWLRFQCLHALGHGLTAFFNHDLPRALKACDALADEWDQRSCYGGAFMENALHGTGLHHASPQHHANPEHHAHHSMSAEPVEFVPVKADDPHHPCSVLEERYLAECYLMQTSVILHQNQGSFEKAFGVCDAAPAAMRPWCYQGLGRDVSSHTLQDPEDSIRLCSLGDPRYQPWCYVGLVKNFIDVTAKSEQGLTFCPRVPGRASQLKCHEAVGEEVWILAFETDQRAALCVQADAEAQEACRYGARLRADPPPGMPGMPAVER